MKTRTLRGKRFNNEIGETTTAKAKVKGRSPELLKKRNSLLIACYVYFKLYHHQFNYEYTLNAVSERCGFISPFTIGKCLASYDQEIKNLYLQKPSKRWFRQEYPFINWN